MAGHSKWNNIKNRKGAADQKRAKEFSLIAKMIRVAVKEGKSGDPKSNPSLRLALDKARGINMPNVKIQRAIDTGLGKRDGKSLQTITYEGYGPGGVGLMIVANTDNTQRTSGEMRFILSRNGGSLGSPGSVQFLFTRGTGEEWVPSMPMKLEDPELIVQIEDLIDQLRENDDVEDVFAAAEWATAEA
ncbi:MAG TPA: YebC/PmpR family DNA-binding transcriptional regulator [Vitreimonas sp.]|nr:YebC/PmpR family DNA-binding transcriptional regulator [Vitreimonas sp.]